MVKDTKTLLKQIHDLQQNHDQDQKKITELQANVKQLKHGKKYVAVIGLKAYTRTDRVKFRVFTERRCHGIFSGAFLCHKERDMKLGELLKILDPDEYTTTRATFTKQELSEFAPYTVYDLIPLTDDQWAMKKRLKHFVKRELKALSYRAYANII